MKASLESRDRDDVLLWMRANNAGAAAAVDHFWPGTEEAERKRLQGLVRLWRYRERGGTLGTLRKTSNIAETLRMLMAQVAELERSAREAVADEWMPPSSDDLNATLGLLRCEHCRRLLDDKAVGSSCWRCADDDHRVAG